jgi:hypothetical protein
MNDAHWQAAPLSWGHGPRILEIFLEPTCPFSARTFSKLPDLLARVDPECVTVKIRLQSQPWHLFSGILVRCILAIVAHREEFEFENHCGGDNLDATPRQIIARLEHYSGIRLAEAFAIPELDREIKWHCRYARQNGIHVSPTFMLDGLVVPDMSSGEPVEDWIKRL